VRDLKVANGPREPRGSGVTRPGFKGTQGIGLWCGQAVLCRPGGESPPLRNRIQSAQLSVEFAPLLADEFVHKEKVLSANRAALMIG